MKLEIYRMEDEEVLHTLEISGRIKKESTILNKVKDFLAKEYNKKPILIVQGRVDFATGKNDLGYINNLDIGKFNYRTIR